MHGRRLVAPIAAACALTLFGVACGGEDDDGGGAGAAVDLTITAEDFQFVPATIDVAAGETTIEITNTGAVEHSFTLDDDSVGQDVEAGESATVTVDLTESIGFHCDYHPTQMTGTIEVS